MATNPAAPQDLVNRSLRDLTDFELATAQTHLDDAWTLVLTHQPAVAARLDAGDTNLSALVVKIECAAVLRYFSNPDGKLEEHGDDYGARFDSSRSAGDLYLTDDEIEQLGLGDTLGAGNAFTIRPTGTTPDPPLRWPTWEPY